MLPISLLQMTTRMFRLSKSQFRLFSHSCHHMCIYRATRWVPLVEQELFTISEHLSSAPVVAGVRFARFLFSLQCFVDHLLSFFFWNLNCLSFDLQLLISLVLSSCFSSYRSCAFRNRSLNVKSCALDYLHLIFDYD